MQSRPGLLLLLLIVATALVLPACRTLRMGRDVPLDLLGQQAEDEPEPAAEGLAEIDGSESHGVTTAPPPPPPRTSAAEPLPAAEAPPSDGESTEGDPEPGPEDTRAATLEPRSWLSARQLTSAGSSSDGRWDAQGAQIIFQSVRTGGTIANPNPQTWMMDADGERQRRITMGIGVTNGPGFISTSGREVFYASTHHTGETPGARVGPLPEDMELYRQDLDRGGFERLTDSPGFDGDATWCRHGGLLVYTSTRSGDAELYRQAGDETRRLTEAPGPDLAAALSPDCGRVAWVRDGALWVAGSDGSDPRGLVASGVDGPAWHPDGQHLVFSARPAPGEATELFTIRSDGTDLRRLTASSGSEEEPSFSPDGRRLLYSWDRTGTRQLFVADWSAEMGTPTSLPLP